MTEPPAVIDCCRVLFYAEVDETVTYTGRGCVITDGKVVDPAPRLAIAENLYEDDYLVCRCDNAWNVLGVAAYDSVEKAKVRTENSYAGITSKWLQFRELTQDERSEIEEIRLDAQRLTKPPQ